MSWSRVRELLMVLAMVPISALAIGLLIWKLHPDDPPQADCRVQETQDPKIVCTDRDWRR